MAGISGVSGFREPFVDGKPPTGKKRPVAEKTGSAKTAEPKQESKLSDRDLAKVKLGQEQNTVELQDLRRDVAGITTRTSRVEKNTDANSEKIDKVAKDLQETRLDLGRRIDVQAGDLRDGLTNVNNRVDDLSREVKTGDAQLERRIDNLEDRVGDALEKINDNRDNPTGDVTTKPLADKIDALDDKVDSGFSSVKKVLGSRDAANSAKFDELNEQLSKLNEQLENLTEKIGSLEIAIGEFGDVTDKFAGLVAKIISPEFGALSAANINGSFRFAQRGLNVFGILQAAAGGRSDGLGSAGQSFASGLNSLRQGLLQQGFNDPNQAKQLQAALNAALSQATSGLQLDAAA